MGGGGEGGGGDGGVQLGMTEAYGHRHTLVPPSSEGMHSARAPLLTKHIDGSDETAVATGPWAAMAL